MGIWNWEYKEIITFLKWCGCTYKRDSKGSHEFWYNPKTDKSFTVVKPHGGDKHSADGTFLGMLERAGISKEEAKAFKERK